MGRRIGNRQARGDPVPVDAENPPCSQVPDPKLFPFDSNRTVYDGFKVLVAA
jgi:hypothetical protein